MPEWPVRPAPAGVQPAQPISLRYQASAKTKSQSPPKRAVQRSATARPPVVTRRREQVDLEPNTRLIRTEDECGAVRGTEPMFTRHFQQKCRQCVSANNTYAFERPTMQGCRD
jgi:hypothetical protein